MTPRSHLNGPFLAVVVQHCIGGWRRKVGDEVGTRAYEWCIGLVAASPRAVTPSVAFKRTIFGGGGADIASVALWSRVPLVAPFWAPPRGPLLRGFPPSGPLSTLPPMRMGGGLEGAQEGAERGAWEFWTVKMVGPSWAAMKAWISDVSCTRQLCKMQFNLRISLHLLFLGEVQSALGRTAPAVDHESSCKQQNPL